MRSMVIQVHPPSWYGHVTPLNIRFNQLSTYKQSDQTAQESGLICYTRTFGHFLLLLF